MHKQFLTIGIIGKHRHYEVSDSVQEVIAYLRRKKKTIIIDEETAHGLEAAQSLTTCPRNQLGKYCDLVIVVGGDGCFLSAARTVAKHNIPIVGINRGRLGFLTDILPAQLSQRLDDVLDGNYQEEQRFLLHCDISDGDKQIVDGDALNDIVISPGEAAQMIEFDVFINGEFMARHRSDGIIIATPTGSTAYALSGGGPILHPQLDAIALVPMFPHNLNSRPIAIPGNSQIDIIISENNHAAPRLSCDGRTRVAVPPLAKITITKMSNLLRLIHPEGYSFFETLRSKLGWQIQKV
ncbi:MAG: NAD(+) kinase [Legionellales bacterium]|nr:NAD(+) kinase [Legionellales bacterium]